MAAAKTKKVPVIVLTENHIHAGKPVKKGATIQLPEDIVVMLEGAATPRVKRKK